MTHQLRNTVVEPERCCAVLLGQYIFYTVMCSWIRMQDEVTI